MICFTVTFEFDPADFEEAKRLLAELTKATRDEPGNLMYLAQQSQMDPRKFLLYEQYKDQAALETHRAAPHFEKYATNGIYKLMKNRAIEFYNPLF